MKRKNIRVSVGWALIVFGLVANDRFLAALFSRDGELALQSKVVIWLLEAACFVVGLIILRWSSTDSMTGREVTKAAALKISKLFVFISVAFSATILLFVLANVVAWFFLAAAEFAAATGDDTVDHGELLGLNPTQFRVLMNETWQRRLQYEAWVGFRETPRDGTYVRISNEGYRHTEKALASLGDAGYQIFMLGGSTTFGYGVDDRSTIAAYLQLEMDRRFPSARVTVFNFGRAWYYSSQEVALLLDLLRAGRRPDMVVFIDGLNEGQDDPMYTDDIRRFFALRNRSSSKLAIRTYLSSLPLSRALINTAADEFSRRIDRPDPQAILERYRFHRRVVDSLGEEFSYRPYFFIQPVPGYKNEFLNHDRMSREVHQGYVADFDELNERMALLEGLVDSETVFSMADILEDYPDQPFVDSVHYTPSVNRLLATYIADSISDAVRMSGEQPNARGNQNH